MKTPILPAADVQQFLGAWATAGLTPDLVAPLEGLGTEEASAYLRAYGPAMAALVEPRYRELVADARTLAPKLGRTRNKADARARGPETLQAWLLLVGLEERRDALVKVRVALRRAKAIPDVPADDARIARTMFTAVRRAGGAA